MLFTELETERLILKNIGLDDAEFILKQFSNEEVSRYLYDEEPFSTLEEAQELVDFYTQEDPRNQHRWILVRKDNGEKIGTCGFHCWDRNKQECELGYDLYPDFQKSGYMTEALKAAIGFAKEQMQVKQIEAHIFVDNPDSKKCAIRQGFVDSGRTYNEVFRGKDYLHHIYTLNLD